MSQQPAITILWRGRETVSEVLNCLRPAADIELHLAEEYHHALFRALHPNAPLGQPEELDAAGGPELLQQLGHISGLQGIETLIMPLRRANARVHIYGRAKISIRVPHLSG